VGIHKSKGYAILNTLMESGLVVRSEGTKTYALGPGILTLSRSVLDHADLRSGVAPFLEGLSRTTGCTALLGLVSAGRVVVTAKREPEVGVAVAIRVGHRYPLTWGAHGKAITAFLEDKERREVLSAARLYFWGDPPRPAVDVAGLEAELAAYRHDGYATDLGKVQAGVSAASAPVLGSGAHPIGAVMAVGTFPHTDAVSVGRAVAETAQELSRLLGPTLQSLYGPGK
jgi:DNA-binding IclR family transcriptional regulator